MRVHGSRVVHAPREAVFAAICDPNALLAVIPGCTGVELDADGSYRGGIALRLPGVTGTYRTTVRLVDTEPPVRGTLRGEVRGALGRVQGSATFELTDGGDGTTVSWDGQASLDGPLARLDNRFLEGLTGTLIGQGLANLDNRLRRERVAGIPASKETAG